MSTTGCSRWPTAACRPPRSTASSTGCAPTASPEKPAGPPDELLDALRAGDCGRVADALANDLQPAALSLRPELADVLAAGAELGALGGVVSGSGPTCAFLCAHADAASDLADELDRAGVCASTRVATAPAPGAADHRLMAEPGQSRGGRQGLRDDDRARGGLARARRRRAHRRRRPQRRRQDHAAAADHRPGDAGHRPGHRHRRHDRSPASTSAASCRWPRVRDVVVGDAAEHEWAGDAAGARGADRARPGRRSVSTRSPTRSPAASAAASRSRPRWCSRPTCSCSTSRPTTSTSRASPGSPATSPPGAARCWWSPTTGGSSTPSCPGPGRSATARCGSSTAGTPPTCSPAPSATGRPPPARRGGRTCCARSWPGCGAARRPARPSRGSASRRPRR